MGTVVVYLIGILGTNHLRQAVLPLGTVPEWAVVVIVVAMSAAIFVVITVAYRIADRR